VQGGFPKQQILYFWKNIFRQEENIPIFHRPKFKKGKLPSVALPQHSMTEAPKTLSFTFTITKQSVQYAGQDGSILSALSSV